MKNKLFILTSIFAIIGVIALILFIREINQKDRLEQAYETNCKNVKVGMTINEVREVMNEGLDINYRGFDFDIQTPMDTISEISMNYSIDGGSYIIRINKETGKVQSVNYPKNN